MQRGFFRSTFTRGWRGVLTAATTLGAAGCTGLEPSAVSAGASVAQSGVTFFGRGKAQSFELATVEEVAAAVRRTGERMALERTADTTDDDGNVRITYRDEERQYVDVTIRRRTPAVTQVKTDVGIFGNSGLSGLLMVKTLDDLHAKPPPPGENEKEQARERP